VVAAGLVAATLLAGCSGADDETPTPSTTSTAPSSARTPPPISPRTTVSFSPGTTLPGTPSPSTGSAVPIPIPSAPDN
jgi:hypothetical protein